MIAPSRPWEIDDRAPTLKEKDACLDAMMEQQEWEDKRYSAIAGHFKCHNARRGGNRDKWRHPLVQAPLPPLRIKAALGSLRQALQSGLLLVESPQPYDTGGAASKHQHKSGS